MSEQLYYCGLCGRTNFTERGYMAHKCSALKRGSKPQAIEMYPIAPEVSTEPSPEPSPEPAQVEASAESGFLDALASTEPHEAARPTWEESPQIVIRRNFEGSFFPERDINKFPGLLRGTGRVLDFLTAYNPADGLYYAGWELTDKGIDRTVHQVVAPNPNPNNPLHDACDKTPSGAVRKLMEYHMKHHFDSSDWGKIDDNWQTFDVVCRGNYPERYRIPLNIVPAQETGHRGVTLDDTIDEPAAPVGSRWVIDQAYKEADESKVQPATSTETAVVPVAKAPVVPVTASWDGARKWRDAAKKLEEGKLFAQVMLGFELIALKAQHSQPGKRSDLEQPDDAKVATWEETVKAQLSFTRQTAYILINLAEAARPKLKKLPTLASFDPSTTSVSSLPPEDQEALSKVVRKLTDGTTQAELMAALGVLKGPSNKGGRKKGDGGKESLSIAEQAELMKEKAREDWGKIEESLLAHYHDKFLLLTDPEVDAQIGALEKALKARRAWLAKRPEHRTDDVVKEISELLQ
jgi:hypothetical protein